RSAISSCSRCMVLTVSGMVRPELGASTLNSKPLSGGALRGCTGRVLKLQTDEGAFLVRKVADDFAERCGQLPHQRGNRDDLMLPGKLRPLFKVNDLDDVLARQVPLAQLLERGQGAPRFRGRAGDVQAQPPLFLRNYRRLGGSLVALGHFRPPV